jgi:hypothetical protein
MSSGGSLSVTPDITARKDGTVAHMNTSILSQAKVSAVVFENPSKYFVAFCKYKLSVSI